MIRINYFYQLYSRYKFNLKKAFLAYLLLATTFIQALAYDLENEIIPDALEIFSKLNSNHQRDRKSYQLTPKCYNGYAYVCLADHNSEDITKANVIVYKINLNDSNDITEYMLRDHNNTKYKLNNDSHNYLILEIDSKGHIHITGNTHNNDRINYWVSSEPEKLSSITMIQSNAMNLLQPGEENRVPLGRGFTYPRFWKSPNGILFYGSRSIISGPNRRSRSLVYVLSRYNSQTKTWTMIGDDIPSNQGGHQQNPVFMWEDDTESGFYQHPKLDISFDKSGRMHIAGLLLNKTPDEPWGGDSGSSSKHQATDVIYAYSDDYGDTLKRLDGSDITLPIRVDTVNGGIHSPDIVYTENDGPWYWLNMKYIWVGTDWNNNPIIEYESYKNGHFVSYQDGNGNWIQESLNLNDPLQPRARPIDLNGVRTTIASNGDSIIRADKDQQKYHNVGRVWNANGYASDRQGVTHRFIDKSFYQTSGKIIIGQTTTRHRYRILKVDVQSDPLGSIVKTALTPTKDTFVREGMFSETNFGNRQRLFSKNSETEATRRAYLSFNLNSLPSKTVTQAKLRLKIESTDQIEDLLKVHFIQQDNWSETVLDWNNQPSIGKVLDTQSGKTQGEWIEFDVTQQVKQETLNDESFSVCIINHQPLAETAFYSKESTPDNQPQLLVTTGGKYLNFKGKALGEGLNVMYEGKSLQMQGSKWKSIPFDYQITPKTVLEFSLNIDDPGKILAIALDEDWKSNNARRDIQLAGERTWGSFFQDSRTNHTENHFYSINIGNYYTGKMNFIRFIGFDNYDASMNVIFSNVKIYESN